MLKQETRRTVWTDCQEIGKSQSYQVLQWGRSWKDDLSISDTERKIRTFPIGVEPTDLLLLVQMLYYWATGVSWEQRPLNSTSFPGFSLFLEAFFTRNDRDEGEFCAWWIHGKKQRILEMNLVTSGAIHCVDRCLTALLLSNSENREHLKIFRNVDCVLANHSKVQDTRANLKTTN